MRDETKRVAERTDQLADQLDHHYRRVEDFYQSSAAINKALLDQLIQMKQEQEGEHRRDKNKDEA
jgi:hypothetical protein